MKNVRMFEVVPGTKIMVTEQGEIPADDSCQKFIDNEPRFKRGPADPTLVPEQWLRNKLAKNNGWSVVKSGFDNNSEQFWFECAINAQMTEIRKVGYNDVCKIMHWKAYTFEDNGMRVRFVDDLSWYEPLPVKKTTKRGRKAKAAK